MAEIEASRDNGNDYNSKDLFVDAELEGAFLSLEENWRMEMGDTLKDGIKRRSERRKWEFSGESWFYIFQAKIEPFTRV